MTGAATYLARWRQRLRAAGVVQGVGFRPFVYRLAHRLALAGWVRNDGGGVTIEVEGPEAALEAFRHGLRAEAPPLARIDSLVVEASRVVSESAGAGSDFVIDPSTATGDERTTEIPPDIALCPACLAELRDPTDRRYGYPFINCTDCGPRFTLIRDLPYDRPATTMASFELCDPCAAEYHDPASRRFHAQPNACPVCGPRLWAERPGEAPEGRVFDRVAEGSDAVALARRVLAEGGIVAIKGVGGFHLACDATSARAVARLRRRKQRPHKPLALMAADLDIVRRHARVSAAEAEALKGRDRPIVLLRRRPGASDLAEGIAPGQATLGFLLPYAPIHHLLLGERPLVMTSGNTAGEPIVTDNDDARRRLAHFADLLLFHDRAIHQVCDDSVVRIFEGAPMPIRLARGHTPVSLALPAPRTGGAAPPLLAVGGELKSVFALTRGGRVFASQHLGDMGSLETLEVFERAVEHFLHLFRVSPEAVVCDLHPGYLSSRWASEWATAHGLPLLRVQHHHAHVAGAMAEHGLGGEGPVLGVSFDGTGYGPDGAVWGGEVLLADYRGFRRVAHLRPTFLPGGDGAIQHPGRMALAHLHAAGLPWGADLPPVMALDPTALRVLKRQLERRLVTVPTTSMGRLFDAVAALVGLRQEASFEGQPAMELEALAEGADFEIGGQKADGYRFAIDGDPGGDAPLVLDPRPVLAAMVDDLTRGRGPAALADGFHTAVAEAVAETCDRLHRVMGVATVMLTGGVFQNLVLLRRTVRGLRARGLEPLVHRRFPPNDGGLAIGQAVLAGHRLAAGGPGPC